jgi:hypothetical protein
MLEEFSLRAFNCATRSRRYHTLGYIGTCSPRFGNCIRGNFGAFSTKFILTSLRMKGCFRTTKLDFKFNVFNPKSTTTKLLNIQNTSPYSNPTPLKSSLIPPFKKRPKSDQNNPAAIPNSTSCWEASPIPVEYRILVFVPARRSQMNILHSFHIGRRASRDAHQLRNGRRAPIMMVH